ncbi:MAG: hypothetical protein ACR2QO_25120 [Acidimicrobiales bacterium]
MVDLLVSAFPLIAGGVAVIVLVLAVRLDRKLSRGAYSAGPRDPERPAPPGQKRTPWELQAIEDQLQLMRTQSGRAVPRYDLNATVNRLIVAARLDDQDYQLPITADEAEIGAAVSRIEDRLGLDPFDGTEPGIPQGAQSR